ncbi:alpha/beta hydrolase [Celeribacter baekdonensis]|uniref:alpha/beta hydrolase n=1 Tax=Celeribacter baekdonensis TaxID=875171 RepID=UPI0030D796FF
MRPLSVNADELGSVRCLNGLKLSFWAVLMGLCGLVLGAKAQASDPSTSSGVRGCVILLHGLARTDASMAVLAQALKSEGYYVINHAYPSRQAPIDILAETALLSAREDCRTSSGPSVPPNVVTHSMGGILLRVFAQAHPDLEWGRVVMMGPPNHGSEIVDMFETNAAFVDANGPAGLQLGTNGLPDTLPPLPFEAGVIAGSQSLNPLLSAIVEGKDDGKVSIESTKVEGMKAHLTLPVTHTFMMQNPRVIVQVLNFLDTGTFVADLSFAEALRRLAGE